jgi:hypothetical protein
MNSFKYSSFLILFSFSTFNQIHNILLMSGRLYSDVYNYFLLEYSTPTCWSEDWGGKNKSFSEKHRIHSFVSSRNHQNLDSLYLSSLSLSLLIEISFQCVLWITLFEFHCHWIMYIFFDIQKVDFQAPVLLAWGLFLQQCAQVPLCFSLIGTSLSSLFRFLFMFNTSYWV